MSEVGLFYVLKQRSVGINPITHDPGANARREASLMRDLTSRSAAVVDGFCLTNKISHLTFTVAARTRLITVCQMLHSCTVKVCRAASA